MKSIFYFLFESSPKQRIKRDMQMLNAFIEGLKQSQKGRRERFEAEQKLKSVTTNNIK